MVLSNFSKTDFKDAAKHDFIVSLKVRVLAEMGLVLPCADGRHQVSWGVSPSF